MEKEGPAHVWKATVREVPEMEIWIKENENKQGRPMGYRYYLKWCCEVLKRFDEYEGVVPSIASAVEMVNRTAALCVGYLSPRSSVNVLPHAAQVLEEIAPFQSIGRCPDKGLTFD
jgi:hypothetical protein